MARVVLRAVTVEVEPKIYGVRDIAIADGTISAIEKEIPVVAGDQVHDLKAHFVIPGLANCHTHSNENWFRGKFDNLPLEPWMTYAYPALYAPPSTAREVYLRTLIGAIEAARTGTTSVVDFIYEHAGFTEERIEAMVRAYRDVGIRAQLCIAIADRPYQETVVLDSDLLPDEVVEALERQTAWSSEESMAFVRSMVAKFHDPAHGISIGLGPSGPQRCTDQMLRDSRDLAEELDLQIHTHVLETKMQRQTGMDLYGKSIVEHLADIDFLSPRTHLVHGVWLDDNDVEILARTGATIVHNPISNLKLGSGVSPVTALREGGVPVSLGTDGMCAGDGQNMLEAMKLAGILHKSEPIAYNRWLGARDALEMATVGGSLAMGAAGLRGVIAVGQQADILAFDLNNYAFTPLNDPVVHVALQIPTQALTHVFVGGELVFADNELCHVDESALLQEVRDIGERVVADHQEAFAFGDALLPSLAAGWERVRTSDLSLHRQLG